MSGDGYPGVIWIPAHADRHRVQASRTIDAIVLKGIGDSTIYIDTVAQNPNGSLLPIEGDFNADWLVDEADYALWEAGFGADKSGSDWLAWQRNFAASAASSASLAGVPEPSAAILATVAAALLGVRWPKRI